MYKALRFTNMALDKIVPKCIFIKFLYLKYFRSNFYQIIIYVLY